LLKLTPANLPTYVYDLTADVAFLHRDGVFKLRRYSFSQIRVVTNQPLKKGDSLDSTAYYPGNSSTEIIPHLIKKGILCGAEKELKYYCGCIVDELVISYSSGRRSDETCGEGKCTVFIELSASKTGDQWRKLDDFGDIDEITKEHHDAWQKATEDYEASGNIDWWKARVPDWDERLEYIGQISDFVLWY